MVCGRNRTIEQTNGPDSSISLFGYSFGDDLILACSFRGGGQSGIDAVVAETLLYFKLLNVPVVTLIAPLWSHRARIGFGYLPMSWGKSHPFIAKTPNYFIGMKPTGQHFLFSSPGRSFFHFSFILVCKDFYKIAWRYARRICVSTTQAPQVFRQRVPFVQVESFKFLFQENNTIGSRITIADSLTILRRLLPEMRNLKRLSIKPHKTARFGHSLTIPDMIDISSCISAPITRLTWLGEGPPSSSNSYAPMQQSFKELHGTMFSQSLQRLKFHAPMRPQDRPELLSLGRLFPQLAVLDFPMDDFRDLTWAYLRDPNFVQLARALPQLRELRVPPEVLLQGFRDWADPGEERRVVKSILHNRFANADELQDILCSKRGSLYELCFAMSTYILPTAHYDGISHVKWPSMALQFPGGTHSAVAAFLLGAHSEKYEAKADSKYLVNALKALRGVNLAATSTRVFTNVGGISARPLKIAANPVQAAIVCHKPVMLKILLQVVPDADVKKLAGGSGNLFHIAINYCTTDKLTFAAFQSIISRKEEFGILPYQAGEENEIFFTPLEACLQAQKYQSALALHASGMKLVPSMRRSVGAPWSLCHATFAREGPIDPTPVLHLLVQEKIRGYQKSGLFGDVIVNKFPFNFLARLAASTHTELVKKFLPLATQKDLDVAYFDLCCHNSGHAVHEAMLLAAGANPAALLKRHPNFSNNMNAFMMACLMGSMERIDTILKKCGPQIAMIKNSAERFPAMYAARSAKFLRRNPMRLLELIDGEEIQYKDDKVNLGYVAMYLSCFYNTATESVEHKNAVVALRRAMKKLMKSKYPATSEEMPEAAEPPPALDEWDEKIE